MIMGSQDRNWNWNLMKWPAQDEGLLLGNLHSFPSIYEKYYCCHKQVASVTTNKQIETLTITTDSHIRQTLRQVRIINYADLHIDGVWEEVREPKKTHTNMGTSNIHPQGLNLTVRL